MAPRYQKTALGIHIYIARVKVIGNSKAHVDSIDAILTDSHLHTINRIERNILINVILPKLEYAGEVWEGNARLVIQLETV